MTKIAISGNKGTEQTFRRALKRAGYEVSLPSGDEEMLLIDFDTPYYYHARLIENYVTRNKSVLLIPHGANPSMGWDGIHPVSDGVRGIFVPGPGHKVVLAAYDYPRPIHIVGWPFSPLKPFYNSGEGYILFAPIHPLHEISYSRYREANHITFTRLLETKLPLKVRHLHGLKENGIWEAPGVEYIEGGTLDTSDIDRADVVVAWGTLLHLAVARGKYAVAFGSDIPFADYLPGKGWVEAEHWVDYCEFIRYPFDVRDHTNITVMLDMAVAGVEEIRKWRELFVGEVFDNQEFIRIIKETLGD